MADPPIGIMPGMIAGSAESKMLGPGRTGAGEIAHSVHVGLPGQEVHLDLLLDVTRLSIGPGQV